MHLTKEQYAALPEEEKERYREKCREYGKAHRKELNEWAREYRKNNKELIKEQKRIRRQKLKKMNPEKMLLQETKKRARARGIVFNLETSDIVIPKVCPILGIELSFGVGRVHDASPSLDRIVPGKGYVKGNCFIISAKANRMKQENTLETLEMIVAYIKERI